jgi:hypothetical protein
MYCLHKNKLSGVKNKFIWLQIEFNYERFSGLGNRYLLKKLFWTHSEK